MLLLGKYLVVFGALGGGGYLSSGLGFVTMGREFLRGMG